MSDIMKLGKEATMSSIEIAEITGKQHKHVLRDCYVLNETYHNINQPKIGLVNYKAGNGQMQPMAELTKSQTLDLMMGYSIELRIKVRMRWEELETAALPKTLPDALRAYANQVEETEKTRLQLEEATKTIKENEPKVVFANTVSGSSNSILIRQFAKDLCDDTFNIGQNRLFEWFRENKYLNQLNEPYQNYVEMGLFEVITRTVGSGTETFTAKTTKITGKGQVYFTKKIKAQV